MRSRTVWLLAVTWLAACAAGETSLRARPSGDPLAELDAATLHAQGKTLARSGDLVRAEQYLRAAVARGFPPEEVTPLLIDVCLRASRYGAALGYAQAAVERRPEDWRVRLLAASLLHYAVHDSGRARVELETIVSQAPEEPMPRWLLGVVLADGLGQRRAAAAQFRRYLALDPQGRHAADARAALARRAP